MAIHLTDSECEKVLASNRYAHLGCIDGDEPYVVPITYVYRGEFFFGFTQEGLKVDVMRKHPKICVQVENVQNSREWESVICWGSFEEVTDEKMVQEVKLLFAEQHGQGILSEGKPPVSPMMLELHRQRSDMPDMSVVYRMKPYRMTGRAER